MVVEGVSAASLAIAPAASGFALDPISPGQFQHQFTDLVGAGNLGVVLGRPVFWTNFADGRAAGHSGRVREAKVLLTLTGPVKAINLYEQIMNAEDRAGSSSGRM